LFFKPEYYELYLERAAPANCASHTSEVREPRQRSARAALWHPCYKPSNSYLYSLNIKNFEISGSQGGEYEDDAVSTLHGAISQKAVASFTLKVLCVYGQQKTYRSDPK
jgi:hypothetical protein